MERFINRNCVKTVEQTSRREICEEEMEININTIKNRVALGVPTRCQTVIILEKIIISARTEGKCN